MSWLQKYPHLLELVYDGAHSLLLPFRRWLRPGGAADWLFVQVERASKGLIFDCRMCGQCVLHSTGMTCPQTCPKNLRNGPCGGVRPDGHCEVIPGMRCVWVEAWERSKRMPRHGEELLRILPPLDRRLQDTSAWINELCGRTRPPAGWN